MIKASDFRKGNMILRDLSIDDFVEERVTIYALATMAIEEEEGIKTFLPVPLTPEILERLNLLRVEPSNDEDLDSLSPSDEAIVTTYRELVKDGEIELFGTEDGFLTLRCEDNNWDDVAMDVFIQTGNMKEPAYITNVSYAHELQNLYHSLMKQEL
jgi:hypothetical protein